ncbi:MAG: hypothetical protein L0G37_15770, partial [Pseudomonas sp.]|nr:hypothetical protein [Pseudomonas sp.]
VDGGDQGQILGLGLRHGLRISVDNLAIVPRSTADANALCFGNWTDAVCREISGKCRAASQALNE